MLHNKHNCCLKVNFSFNVCLKQTEKCEKEIVRPAGRKIMPNKLQFDLQKSKNKKMKKKQKKPKSKGSRDTNPVKDVRWNSMERLRPECEYCMRFSLTDERLQKSIFPLS